MSVIIINRGMETRRSTSGKVRRSIRIDADVMTINTDPKSLGKPVADGIANHYRKAVKAIAGTASAATLEYRKRASKAFAAGKSWAVQRYAGGKIGAKPPNQSTALFNDSDRFADSIVANASSDGAWRVNVAANRLDDRSGNPDRIWNRLVSLVPEFANVALLFEQNAIMRQTVERISKERVKITKAATHFQSFAATFFRRA